MIDLSKRCNLILGDCLEKLKEIPENSIDAIITDPPYELGFMGKAWDNSGIANNVEMWKEVNRVLKSGGHLLSFGGTRTYHRMACAIEDVGFEIRDMVEDFEESFASGDLEKYKQKYLVRPATVKPVSVDTYTKDDGTRVPHHRRKLPRK